MKALTTEQLLPLVKNGTPEANRPYYAWWGFGASNVSTCLQADLIDGRTVYIPIMDVDVKAVRPSEFVYLDDYINALAGGAE